MNAYQRSPSPHKRAAVRKPPTTKASTPTAQTVNPTTLQSAVRDPSAILSIQHLYGNRAVQRMLANTPHAPDEDEVQREAAGSSLQGGPLTSDLSQVIQRSRGSGAPLDRSFSARMSSAFGADFSGVRVHTDRQAEQLNRSVSAKAFTLGSDIYFSRGSYNPGSSGGQELLAHELTHVVQQGGSKSNRAQAKLSVGPAGDPYEQEADRAAARIAKSSGPIKMNVSQRTPARLQRWEALGPWGSMEKGIRGSPVHETMTTLAMRNARYGGVGRKTKFHDAKAWEMAGRGATWNDDPEGLLHDENTSMGLVRKQPRRIHPVSSFSRPLRVQRKVQRKKH